MCKNYIKRKEKIIISAIKILDELGIHGLTIRELAKQEGISEPAIYRQFHGKKDILIAIVKRFSEYDNAIKNTIIQHNMSPKEAILYFAEAYATYYHSYPEIASILFSFDLYKYESEIKKEMQDIINDRLAFITEIIKNGQTIKVFDDNIDAKDFAELILGVIWSMTYNWKLEDSNRDLKEHIMRALNWLLR
ncbi:TetR/AcrR family transcriptional regulator [Clostridium thailandense]|uniref:TetR/AcrR family transcriptional regulator n=1 Tax=Clostridium thailandense TaxID=2794346 RepID=UPI0039891C8F